MSRTTKPLRCTALAVLSFAVLALPAAAPAHEGGAHAPVTAACPGGDQLSDAICFVLRGLEYSVRHGGTVGTANELNRETQRNADRYETRTVKNAGAFQTKLDVALEKLDDGLADGVDNALLTSDLYGAGLIVALDDSLNDTPLLTCPLNDVNPGVFPNTVQALKVFFCAQWAPLMAGLPGFSAEPLGNHIEKLPDALGDIEEPLRITLVAFGRAVKNGSASLANTTSAATQKLGANQVFDTFYAAQCVRKGDYGPFARPKPCPK